jgi:hypothetical protein
VHSHDTFSRLFRQLDPEQFRAALSLESVQAILLLVWQAVAAVEVTASESVAVRHRNGA